MINIKELESYVKQLKTGSSNTDRLPGDLKQVIMENKPFDLYLNNEKDRILANELNFSNHAINRLQSRNVQFTNLDKLKIVKGINRLKDKNADNSLVVLKDLAMIVSVKNKTVVTVMDKGQNSDDAIFTNIDSALFLK